MPLIQIVIQMARQAATSYHLAGLVDSATSNDLHHHEIRRMLAIEKTRAIKGDGIYTLRWLLSNDYLTSQTFHFFS